MPPRRGDEHGLDAHAGQEVSVVSLDSELKPFWCEVEPDHVAGSGSSGGRVRRRKRSPPSTPSPKCEASYGCACSSSTIRTLSEGSCDRSWNRNDFRSFRKHTAARLPLNPCRGFGLTPSSWTRRLNVVPAEPRPDAMSAPP